MKNDDNEKIDNFFRPEEDPSQNEELHPQLENLLEEEEDERKNSIEQIKNVTHILKTQYRDDLLKSSNDVVLTQSKKILQDSMQKTRIFQSAPVKDSVTAELIKETQMLQKILANNLEYIENLGNNADQGIKTKKKALKIYQIICLFLLGITVGLVGYYKLVLTTEEQEHWKSLVADKLRDLKILEEKVEEKKQLVENKEKEVTQKEQQVVTKEKEVGQKEKEVASKEKEVGQKEQLVGKKEKEIGQKEKLIVTKEKEVTKKEQWVKRQKELLDTHLQLEDKASQISERFVLEKKLQDVRSFASKKEESSQQLFMKVRNLNLSFDPGYEYISQEFFVTIREPERKMWNQKQEYLKWLGNALDSRKEIVTACLSEIAQVRKNQNEDLDLMEEQNKKFSGELDNVEKFLNIHESFLTELSDYDSKADRATKEYETILIRELTYFKDVFQNLQTLDDLQNKTAKALDEASEKKQDDQNILIEQKQSIADVKKDLPVLYRKYIQRFQELSHEYMSVIKNSPKIDVEHGFSAKEIASAALEISSKSKALQGQIPQIQKIYGSLDRSNELESLEKKVNQSFVALNSIVIPEKKPTPTVAVKPTSPDIKKTVEPGQADIEKAVMEMGQLFEFSPAEYLMDVQFFAKDGAKFKVAHQMQFKILSKNKGEMKDMARFFIAKTLLPRQERGTVLLKKDRQVWVYDIKERNIVRNSPEGESGGDSKKKMLNSLLSLGRMNPYLYSIDLKKETVVVNNKNAYRARLFLNQTEFPEQHPEVFVLLSQDTLSPFKLEFCNQNSNPVKIFYLMNYQETELGKKVKTIQFLDNTDKSMILQITYSNIKKREIPDYYFEENYMTTFSSSH
ncbi:MAG: hypothetical protein HUU50_01850 [Candidatus Brocadiae bacterium]|nr:hypothetical protein [Candidatus Brocadiia bacterium]